MTTARNPWTGGRAEIFGERITLASSEVQAMVVTLEAAASRHRGRRASRCSPVLATRLYALQASLLARSGQAVTRPSGRATTPECLAEVVLEREAALDIAAELLDVAGALSDAGCPLEAFALEGVEGRLLESLLSVELS
jgi:hypothetical protein